MLVEFGVIWSPPLSYQKSFALYFHYRCPPCFEKWDLCDAMPPFDISFVVLYNWITLVLSFSACRHKWHFMCLSLTVQYALHIFFFANGIGKWTAFIWFTAINMGATNSKDKCSSIHIYICKRFLWLLWERFLCG